MKFMGLNMSSVKALVFLFVISVSGGAQYSQASLMWNFGFDFNVDGFEGNGSFTLGGPTKADGLLAFSYAGKCGGVDCSFGLSDVDLSDDPIDGTWWNLDTTTWEFIDLHISAYTGYDVDINIGRWILVEEDSLYSERASFTVDDGYRLQSVRGFYEGTSDDYAFLNPVPTPATLALFGLGLAALGMTRRKRAHS
jgi:PEP-CTERM motif